MVTVAAVAPPDILFYHANCPDGFGAAWAYWRAAKNHQDPVPAMERRVLGRSLEFYAIGHHDKNLPSVKGKHVIMVDVALQDEAMMDVIAKEAQSFRLIDHHQSSFDLYSHKSWAFFDLNKSGCVLAWEDSHPGEPIPRLLQCIQERDLECMMDVDTESILQVLDSTARTFYDWDILNDTICKNPESVLQDGRLMRDRVAAAVVRLIQNAIPIAMNGYKGWAVNSQIELGTLAANRLSDRPDSDFGFSWYVDQDGLVRGSWRSKTINVIDLAKRYNGGGHPYSAGATLTLLDIQDLLGLPQSTLPHRDFSV